MSRGRLLLLLALLCFGLHRLSWVSPRSSNADVADAHHAQGGGGGDAAGGTARGGRGADRGLARLPGTAGAAGGK